MKIRDNRDTFLGKEIVNGRIVSLYYWEGGVTVTLDTGYDIVLSNSEIEEITTKQKLGKGEANA